MVTTATGAAASPWVRRSSRFARANALAASSLVVCTRRSSSPAIAGRDLVVSMSICRGPAATSLSAGTTISGAPGSTGIDAVHSTVSCTHFKETQPPVNRDMAMPMSP